MRAVLRNAQHIFLDDGQGAHWAVRMAGGGEGRGEWAQPLTPPCFPATLTRALANMHVHINTLIHTHSHTHL